MCPVCNRSKVTEIYLEPLVNQDLDHAVKLRKEEGRRKAAKAKTKGLLADSEIIDAESSYLLLNRFSSGNATNDHDYQRTGRWTDEETAYVEFLVNAFDKGKIPLRPGVKLNEFLSDLLLCKNSRLTKKMKNARLSIRQYSLSLDKPLDLPTLNLLEKGFLQSVAHDATRFELRFNLDRFWRSQLSDLCAGMEIKLLDASDWMASLEALENRALEAEERIRQARRAKLGMLRQATSQNEASSSQKRDLDFPLSDSFGNALKKARGPPSGEDAWESSSIQGWEDFDEDFGAAGDGEMFQHQPSQHATSRNAGYSNNSCGEFLDSIIQYIVTNQLPFQLVNAWVPSLQQVGPGSQVQLIHAGYVSHPDLGSTTSEEMARFGEYSKSFKFPSGTGLPGRVLASQGPQWERGIDRMDPSLFLRSEGAKSSNIKTGFGLPVKAEGLDLIVVTMYSTNDLLAFEHLIAKCMEDIGKFCPQPKWKLVVDMPQKAHQTKNENPKVEQHNDNQIAEVLGRHMPLSSLPAPGFAPSSEGVQRETLDFMCLRLLLLREESRRSESEKEMVDILRKSYQGYVENRCHSEKDIAFLLARDYQFLKVSMGAEEQNQQMNPYGPQLGFGMPLPPPAQAQQHFPVPAVIVGGAPIMKPMDLQFVNPAAMIRVRSESAITEEESSIVSSLRP